MKTSISLVICVALLFTLPWCAAELDVRVSSYNSTSKLAKIDIANTNTEGYSQVMLTITPNPPILVVDYLNPSSSALIPKIIEPGTYDVILTTKEGLSVNKTLAFLENDAQLASEMENSEKLWKLRQEDLVKNAQKVQERLNEQINEEGKRKAEAELIKAEVDGKGTRSEPKKKAVVKYWLITIGVSSLIGLAVIIFKATRTSSMFKKKGKGPEVGSDTKAGYPPKNEGVA